MQTARPILAAAALLCLLAGVVFSQSGQADPDAAFNYATGDPADWPKESDAVIAAPDFHKVLLENDDVRVLNVSISPGVVEPLHSHSRKSVLYIQAAGDFIDRDAEGNVIFDLRQMESPLEFPLTMWKEPEAPHSVENLSDTITIRLLRVEIKND